MSGLRAVDVQVPSSLVRQWCDSSGLAGPLQEMASSAPDDRPTASLGDGEEEEEEMVAGGREGGGDGGGGGDRERASLSRLFVCFLVQRRASSLGGASFLRRHGELVLFLHGSLCIVNLFVVRSEWEAEEQRKEIREEEEEGPCVGGSVRSWWREGRPLLVVQSDRRVVIQRVECCYLGR